MLLEIFLLMVEKRLTVQKLQTRGHIVFFFNIYIYEKFIPFLLQHEDFYLKYLLINLASVTACGPSLASVPVAALRS